MRATKGLELNIMQSSRPLGTASPLGEGQVPVKRNCRLHSEQFLCLVYVRVEYQHSSYCFILHSNGHKVRTVKHSEKKKFPAKANDVYLLAKEHPEKKLNS